ncbi:hypothetical protein bAD24_I04605 [Burkholderia sp. AD24]|nr:hypothetical protein bAD24_I04605 [Burkholderia sp. AD24]
MRLKTAIAFVVALVLCYIGAGTPPLGLLFKPSVMSDAIALKPITWHWLNQIDRGMPQAELLASRFYVFLIAIICAVVGMISWGAFATKRRFGYMLTMSLAIIAIVVYAQCQAYYTVA